MQSFFEKRIYSHEKPLAANYGSGLDFRAHWHQDFEMLFVLDGVQGMSVNNHYQVLSAGDLAVCRSRDLHFYDASPGGGRFVMAFVDAGFLREQAGWSDRFTLTSPFLALPDAEASFRRLAEENAMQAPHHAVAMKAAMLDIVVRILRSPELTSEPARGSSTLDPALARIQEALQFMESDFAEDLTYDSLAKKLAISPSYFSRIFNGVTGMGFREYLNHLRVERAEEMLTDPSRTVTEVAFACGFDSIRTFHRAFREVTGRTPLARRRVQVRKPMHSSNA